MSKRTNTYYPFDEGRFTYNTELIRQLYNDYANLIKESNQDDDKIKTLEASVLKLDLLAKARKSVNARNERKLKTDIFLFLANIFATGLSAVGYNLFTGGNLTFDSKAFFIIVIYLILSGSIFYVDKFYLPSRKQKDMEMVDQIGE